MHVNWGIIGAGRIAHQFAEGLNVSDSGRLVATGSQNIERADAIASQWGGSAHDSYEAVLENPQVDAVYIATPHHNHSEWTKKAAAAGKAILCEKPFTLNQSEALGALEAVNKAGVFFMEAFMYRCSPQMRKAKSLLSDGAIGRVRAISSEFSYGASRTAQNFRFDPAVGGGGLMDVGVYCVSFSRMVAEAEPANVQYRADLTPGYDAYGAGLLDFPQEIVAHFGCGVHLDMRNDATVYGDEGSLHIQDPWKSVKGSLMTLRRKGSEPELFDLGCTNAELYAHEADAVASHLDKKECPYMTIADTLGNMQTLDALRASCGLHFSAEP